MRAKAALLQQQIIQIIQPSDFPQPSHCSDAVYEAMPAGMQSMYRGAKGKQHALLRSIQKCFILLFFAIAASTTTANVQSLTFFNTPCT